MSITKTPTSMIDTSGATAGQVLTYNASTITWVPSAASNNTTSTYKLPKYKFSKDTGVIIKNNREIKIWGHANASTMFQSKTNMSNPHTVPFYNGYLATNPTVTIVDAIISNSAVITLLSDGTVWVLGPDEQTLQGRNGVSVPNAIMCFNQVPTLSSIVKIDMTTDENTNTRNCGALNSSGNLYIWGANKHGSCGVAVTADTEVTTPTLALTNVSDFALLNEELYGLSLVKKNDGTLWATGYNVYGQLGIGNKTNQNSFVQCKTGASTYVTNVSSLPFLNWLELKNVMLTDTSGDVWAAGDNTNGQLLDGTTTESLYFRKIITGKNVTKIYTENRNYAIICSNGDLYTWGLNSYGCLGIGLAAANSRYTSITLAASNVKDFRWTGVVSVEVPCQSTLVKNDGTVWSAGVNVANGSNTWTDYNTLTFAKYDVTGIGYLCGNMYNWGGASSGGLSQVWLSSDLTKIYIVYPSNTVDGTDGGFGLGYTLWMTPTDVTAKF